MEFHEVINQRKTSREWTDREVDFEAIKRILEAGMKAPSWDHYRSWQFIVLHEREDKERAFAYAKAVAKRYVDSNRTYTRPNLAQKNVCLCYAEAVYHAGGLSLCNRPIIQMQQAQRGMGKVN